jgi:glycosyltransferase involved in cell wall biosynthesis
MSKTRVAICGIVGIPGVYGGFETFAEQLVLTSSDDVIYTVFCEKQFSMPSNNRFPNCALKKLPLSANGWQSVFYDAFAMYAAAREKQVILLLGCSGAWFIPIAKFLGSTVITNIAGLEWRRSKWGPLAKKVLKFLEWIAVRKSDVVVADNAVLARYVKLAYGRHAETIAYGADHLSNKILSLDHLKQLYNFDFDSYYIAVARCQPDNNVKEIIEAFVKSGKNLVFVSNWNSCFYGKRLKAQFEKHKNIKLLDAVYDKVLITSLRKQSEGYIHGHSAGGTNPTLVEAMWLGLPIFAYDVCFNRKTTNNHAVFWSTSNDLAHCLSANNKQNMIKIARRSRIYAQQNYTWSKIATKYIHLFKRGK